MQLRTIIFLTCHKPFDDRDYERFGIEYFIEKGYQIELIDCSLLIRNDAGVSRKVAALPYHKPRSIEELSNTLTRVAGDGAVVVTTCWGDRTVDKIWRTFRRTNCKVAVATLASIDFGTDSPTRGTGYNRLIENARILELKRWFRKVSYKEVDYWLAAGEITPSIFDKYFKIGRNTRMIWAHSFDYDKALKIPPSLKQEDYIVLLDQNFAHHPDFDSSSDSVRVSPRLFAPAVDRLLGTIEKAEDKEVIIAAHPTTSREMAAELYGGRTVVYNKTAECVKGSSLVLCFMSTAIQYCIIFRKPFLLFRTNELAGPLVNRRSATFAESLGASYLDIENGVSDWESMIRRVDNRFYESWENRYIKKSGTPNDSIWSIFVQAVSVNG